jgi:hypothetical protein
MTDVMRQARCFHDAPEMQSMVLQSVKAVLINDEIPNSRT